jgi:iron complex transport system substrate-binding protein
MKASCFIVTVILFFGCSRQTETHVKTPEQATNVITYSKYLKIFKDKHGIKIHIFNPQSQKTTHLFLAKKQLANIPSTYQFIQTPVSSLITLSGTHIGMLSKLNAIDKVCGISDKKFLFNKTLIAKVNHGKVFDFGSESNLSVEAIIQTKANVLVYSCFGKDFTHSAQLSRMGITCIPNFDWKEYHPLGKAEWIKLFGYLTGKEKLADHYFGKVVKSYQSLVTKAKKSATKPSVFSGNLIGEFWYTPAGDSYMARMFQDANARYVYSNSKGTGSLALSFEKVIAQNIHTEYWLNPGFASVKEILSNNASMQLFKCVKERNVYCYSQNLNKFWELSAIEPDYVLSDLIRIFHPDLESDKPMFFYQKTCK